MATSSSKPNEDETTKPIKLKRLLTVANIQNQSVQRIDFTGEFYEAFGNPQDRGMWCVWGGSGSGKSALLMQMAKEFAKKEKTLYNLLEEEPDDSDYIERTELFNMNEVAENFYTQSYNYKQLCAYLDRKGSAKRVIIDSITYLTKQWDLYMKLKKRYGTSKVIVIVCHAEGQKPKTDFETKIMYDAKMKIFTSGYAAYCKGRTIGPNGGVFIIYPDGYEKIVGAESLN